MIAIHAVAVVRIALCTKQHVYSYFVLLNFGEALVTLWRHD